jgi:fumarate hydratase class II
MPKEIIEGFAYLKAAYANCDLGVLPVENVMLLLLFAMKLLAGKLDDQFPLVIWQTVLVPKAT